mgnify:FL=1
MLLFNPPPPWHTAGMSDRSGDWIGQAHRDMDAAVATARGGYFEWACFISQQAAEKAVKAALQKMGAEAWGHSVTQLLKAVAQRSDVPGDVTAAATVLDRFYVPARYPNGYAAGKPGDYITQDDANDATSSAEAIIRFCDSLLAGS